MDAATSCMKKERDYMRIIVLLAILAAIIILQIYLSKRENKWCGLILPIIIKTTTFYEQECHEIENYFQKNKEQILDECKQKTRQLVKDYEIIKDEYQTVTNMAGINRITSTVVVNKSIC